VRERILLRQDAFLELVLWRLPAPLPGSAHAFKYRLAFVKAGKCLVRYDNEAGKGDHRHVRGRETRYRFQTPEQLIQDFLRESGRVDVEDRDA
jgi:hypothetical protein